MGQSADEAAIRSLTENYFEAYQKKDFDTMVKRWSDKSADFAAYRQTLQKAFTDYDRIEIKNVTIRRIVIQGDKASAQIALEIAAVEAKTGKPASGFGKWNRTLNFVKEENEWKVWQLAVSEEEFAAGIVAAPTDEARKALIASNQELWNAELVSTLTKQARKIFDQGNQAQAFSLYNLALEVAEKIRDTAGKSEVLRLIGLYHSRQGHKDEALRLYQESLRLAQAADNQTLIARAYNSLGVLHYQRGEYSEALQYHQQVKKIAEEMHDEALLLLALNNAAIVHREQSHFTEALAELLQTLPLVRKSGNQFQVLAVLHNIGVVYRHLRKYNEALEHYQNALRLAESLGHKPGIAAAHLDMGAIYSIQGNLTKASEEYEKAWMNAGESPDKRFLAEYHSGLGAIQLTQGNYPEALGSYKSSLQIYEAIEDKYLISRIEQNIGTIYLNLGNYGEALAYFKKCLARDEEIGNPEGVAGTLTHIGELYFARENMTLALQYYERSLKVAEQCDCNEQRLLTLGDIAVLYREQGQLAQALSYGERSLTLAREMGSKYGMLGALDTIGIVNQLQGRIAAALEQYQEGLKLAEEISEKEPVIRFTYKIAEMYKEQGKYGEALAMAGRAAALAKTGYNLDALWRIYYITGEIHRRLNQPEQAKQSFLESIAVIEKAREKLVGNEQEIQNFFIGKNVLYHALIDLLISQNRHSEALAYAEQFKGRVLLDALQKGKVEIAKYLTVQEQEQERKLRSDLRSLNTQITRESALNQPDEIRLKQLQTRLQKARQEYEDFQITIYAAHPELKVQRGEMQPVTLNDEQQLLADPHSALLEFVVTQDKTLLFVITRKPRSPQAATTDSTAQPTNLELQMYTLKIKRDELATLTGNFANLIASRSQSYKASAAKLYDLLRKPAQAQLQTINNLIIVPDDVLWELPFQALLTSPQRFLVQDYAISYAPSLTVLREMTRQQQNRKRPATPSTTLLALGNPDIGSETRSHIEAVFMDEKLEPLPEAERQVKALAQLYGATRSKTYTGPEAREGLVKREASHYRILHLATHGILNNASPMYSHLVLSQSPGDVNEDGLLEAWEIMKLDLNADLVVLSACNTARGKVSTGEGMIGLSWALFVAGCPSAVVSQWKVESASTTTLMVEFHKRLKAGAGQANRRATKAEALRQASLKLLANPQYQHPFYWAAFIVVGDNSWK